MALKKYGVLKGRAVDRRLGAGNNPHYQVEIADGRASHRIAVNVFSKLKPSEVEYHIDDHFQYPFTEQLLGLEPGFHRLESKPGGLALDFIRGNLFEPWRMIPLPYNLPGPDNDLNEKIDHFIQRAMADEDAALYAFGEKWGPEAGKQDKYFGFLPGNGIHDIHMNQGNSGQFKGDNGTYQDGALFIHYPDQDQWVGIFLKFQSQAWHTDDETGDVLHVDAGGPPADHVVVPANHIDPLALPTFDRPDGMLRIVAALVNSIESPERETVTLLNSSSAPIDLDGWRIGDKQKNWMPVQGNLGAGKTIEVVVKKPVSLSNQGGIITLLNPKGIKVHGVSYTRAKAKHPGWTIIF